MTWTPKPPYCRVVCTATGNQTRTYGAEGLNDSISGGAGNDTIYGQFGNDTMDGGTGNDFIDSGTGNDSIVGGDGSDTIIGGTGDNILFGNVGHDSLDGGTGQDFPWGDTSADTLDGGSGCDVVQYRDSDAAVNINLSVALAESSAHAQGDMLRNIEQIDGSEFNDTITAGSSDLVVKGLRGNDSITGGAGRDFLQGATAMTASLAGQETIL